MQFTVRDPDFEAKVRASFAAQGLMRTLGARLDVVAPGEVRIEFSVADGITQQHGYVHAGAVTAIVDSACGYAANTLMAPGAEVLSVEFKVNFVAPARGPRFVAIGRVLRPGRQLTVCSGEVLGVDGETTVTVALMQATMIAVGG